MGDLPYGLAVHPKRKHDAADILLQEPAAEGREEDHLAQRIVTFLRACHIPGLEAIDVETRSGIVFLRGSLSSRDEIRRCVECCRYVGGVLRVVNQIEVSPS